MRGNAALRGVGSKARCFWIHVCAIIFFPFVSRWRSRSTGNSSVGRLGPQLVHAYSSRCPAPSGSPRELHQKNSLIRSPAASALLTHPCCHASLPVTQRHATRRLQLTAALKFCPVVVSVGGSWLRAEVPLLLRYVRMSLSNTAYYACLRSCLGLMLRSLWPRSAC